MNGRTNEIIAYILERERVTFDELTTAFPMEPHLFDELLTEVHASRKITVSGSVYKKKVKKEEPKPVFLDNYPELTDETRGEDAFALPDESMWQPKELPKWKKYGNYSRRKNTKRYL